ncbi:MAG: hypothetical protein E3J54_04450 [Actinobacteria bacterium]|nr:MAG: hypothetical protein E3J54_04450 [Actinomycetota bacterium]
MSQSELLRKVIQALNKEGIQYMITGSFASSMQGEPRLTHDIDLVVALKKKSVDNLVKAFSSEEYYFDKQSAINAINEQDMFNLIRVNEGDKVDFWLLTDEPFDQSRFERRISDEFMSLKLQVSSPEDTILAKLKWAKKSNGSEKQFTDALRVYEVQFEKLDNSYMQHWAKKLDIEKELLRVINSAEPIIT